MASLLQRRGVVVLLTLLPPLWVALNIFVLGLNLPFWDQFQVVPLLIKADEGMPVWPDLLAQHNEHRPFAPRLLWLALAWLTRYNTNAELWLNFGLALLTFGVFLAYTLRFWARHGVDRLTAGVLTPLLSLLVFNMVQWESWLAGIQTIMFLGVLGVMSGFFVLAAWPTWGGLAAAVLLGSVATYSTANALLYWPVLVALVLVVVPQPRKVAMAVCAAGVGAGVVAVFLAGWATGAGSAGDLLRIRLPVFLHWVLNFVGAPLLAYAPAVLLGTMGIVLLGVALVRVPRAALRAGAPYWAMIAFVLATAGLIALGRSGGGVGLALAPRYITQSVWLWAALVALLPLMRLPARLQWSVLALLVVLLGMSTLGGAISGYKWRYVRTLPAYQALRDGAPLEDAALIAIYGDEPPAVTRARLEAVCARGWSVCAAHSPSEAR
jgi:hypothetical protein